MTAPAPPRVIAGFGRSGTTWIQDVLAQANRLRPVFEPLHPDLIPGAAQYAHRYVSASDPEEELYRLLYPFFFERYMSLWSDYRIVKHRLLPRRSDWTSWRKLKAALRYVADSKNNIWRFHPQRRHEARIVKFVRANMMLAWLHERFGARMVFVIRHPAAVVLSQMNAQHAWNLRARLDTYRNDQRLLAVLSERSRNLLFRNLETIEAFTLSWCIENHIALAQAKERHIHVVHYENLLERGEEEWAKLLSVLELESMPDEALIRQPSQQAWGEKANSSQLVRQYDLWMNRLDSATAHKMQKILDATEMTLYSLQEALPSQA